MQVFQTMKIRNITLLPDSSCAFVRVQLPLVLGVFSLVDCARRPLHMMEKVRHRLRGGVTFVLRTSEWKLLVFSMTSGRRPQPVLYNCTDAVGSGNTRWLGWKQTREIHWKCSVPQRTSVGLERPPCMTHAHVALPHLSHQFLMKHLHVVLTSS